MPRQARGRCPICFADLGVFRIGEGADDDEEPRCNEHPQENILVSTDFDVVNFGWDEETDPSNMSLEEIFGFVAEEDGQMEK